MCVKLNVYPHITSHMYTVCLCLLYKQMVRYIYIYIIFTCVSLALRIMYIFAHMFIRIGLQICLLRFHFERIRRKEKPIIIVETAPATGITVVSFVGCLCNHFWLQNDSIKYTPVWCTPMLSATWFTGALFSAGACSAYALFISELYYACVYVLSRSSWRVPSYGCIHKIHKTHTYIHTYTHAT